jgi:CRISPR-associated protein Csm3
MEGVIEAKILISGRIKLITGLHIGAQRETAEIGGLDNPIIKDPVSGMPYIPGSSFKGKLRSLFEKLKNSELSENERGRGEDKFFNRKIGEEVWIHACNKKYDEILDCEVCRLFGTSGGKKGDNFPSRAIFRDSFPVDWDDENIEIKYEAGIDRITSAANPRPMERISPGVEFAFEIVYNVEDNKAKYDLKNLFTAMKLLEDDYLGGSGSRGYGKVEILIDSVVKRERNYYSGEGSEVPLTNSTSLRPEKAVKEIVEKL